MQISGKTRLYGVIGDPIEHTLSPAIQNAAFAAMKMDCIFLAFHVKPAEVEKQSAACEAWASAELNVTMPHKNSVIAYLDQ